MGLSSFYFFRSTIFGPEGEVGLLGAFALLVMPLMFWRILFKNMDAYLRMLFSSVIGAILESMLLKFLVLAGMLLFWVNWIGYAGLVYAYVAALMLPGIIITIIAFRRTERIVLPRRGQLYKEYRKQMWTYGLFGVLTSASGIFVLSIDQLMMVQMLTVADVGVYSVLFFAGMLVNMPGRGVKRIAVPMLSEAWEKNDIGQLQDVYQKSSMTNMITGMYLAMVGWACLNDVLTFLPKYQYAAMVFLFISIGQLVDMMTGVNMEIIATSARYRMNTWFNVLLAILVVVLNLIFIPLWGVVGSAVASCIAMVLLNLLRWYYVKQAFKLDPFTRSTWHIAALGVVLLMVVQLVELPFHPLVNVAIYSMVITAVYWTVVISTKLSPDINAFVKKLRQRLWR